MALRFDNASPGGGPLDSATILAALQSNSAGSSKNPPVYWAAAPENKARPPLVAASSGSKFQDAIRAQSAPKTIPLSQAQMYFYNWSPEYRNGWGDYLASIGYPGVTDENKHDYNTLKTVWNDVLSESVNFTATGRSLDPNEIAKLIAGDGKANAKTAPFTGSKTTTSRSVDLTDPATAKAMVESVMAQALGRAPNPDELTAFRQTLSAAEQANPTTTTTTTQYQADQPTGQTSTTSGGLTSTGAQQLLRDQAIKKPEYGAYQAAATLMGWLGQAISSPV